MYRALVQFYSTWKQAASNLLSAQELILRYNLSSCWNDFNVLDLLFAKVVIDPTQLAEHRFFETENKQIPVTNIRKILG